MNDADELGQTLDRFQNSGSWSPGDTFLIQQPAPGRQAEAAAVFQKGKLIGAACADVLATGIGGGPALRRSASHPMVVEHLRRLGEHLEWQGPMSVEYFYDHESQQPYYIEANPRIGESLHAKISGVPLCDATVRIALGEDVDPLPDATPGIMSHNGFIVMIADAYNGATRFQLFKRLLNHWLGRGDFGSCESDMTRLREDKLSLVPATAVILRLLVAPRSANSLAQGTVDNYSLSYAAATAIDRLPDDFLASIGSPSA
ncbi:MAG: hypothetical protein R3C05_21730 [Pirellulaceae bacterium]